MARLWRRGPGPASRTARHLTAARAAGILNSMVQYSSADLDAAFAAVADPVRRGILERLGRAEASISELAGFFRMTLTGIKKHVAVLEEVRLVSSRKTGRVRTCRLGPRRLEKEAEWIEKTQRLMDDSFDRLESLLERSKE
jgi:DNA-binding transcriptional ArsR family regulator